MKFNNNWKSKILNTNEFQTRSSPEVKKYTSDRKLYTSETLPCTWTIKKMNHQAAYAATYEDMSTHAISRLMIEHMKCKRRC